MTTCGGPARQQHRALKLLDARLGSCDLQAGVLRVRLWATVLVSTGEAGAGAGTAWSQEVALALDGGAVLEPPPAGPLWITEAEVEVAGTSYALLPLPFERAGRVHLALRGAEGGLVIAADGLRVECVGAPRFEERLDGE